MKQNKYSHFNKKNILITGGTGSFGSILVSALLKKAKARSIVIFSRDEMKQWNMNEKFKKNKKLKFVIGDVRDNNRVDDLFANNKFDYVIRCFKICLLLRWNRSYFIWSN